MIVRPATVADLQPINGVIERAVMSWELAERVKRLSLPVYRYTESDLDHLELVVAQAGDTTIGVAAWEPAPSGDVPDPRGGLALHGLYVDPQHHGQHVGTRLLQAAEAAARTRGLAGVLVKAQREAAGFFRKRGYGAVPVTDAGKDYAHRFWKALD
ncbi:MAG: GNAT family N-acetyltransferase [Gammaproteobacteria bacterium]